MSGLWPDGVRVEFVGMDKDNERAILKMALVEDGVVIAESPPRWVRPGDFLTYTLAMSD